MPSGFHDALIVLGNLINHRLFELAGTAIILRLIVHWLSLLLVRDI